MSKVTDKDATLEMDPVKPRFEMPDLPVDVLKRYAGRGPRYTSYPPATAWSTAVGPDEYRAALEHARDFAPNRPQSVYVHIPFCPSHCWFCACNVLITDRTDLADVYLDHVEMELNLLRPSLSKAPVAQLHWGGGSPSYLTPAQMKRLHDLLKTAFTFAPDAEQSIEVDPRITTEDHLAMLAELGFNRLSMGVQDFDPHVQLAIHRLQTATQTAAFVKRCRAHGFQSLNVDLVYGLPKQDRENFARTLNSVCEMSPERLAVYGYAHVPWVKPSQKKIDEATLPGPDLRFDLFRDALEVFLSEGYSYVGMDHFAKPDDELAIAAGNGTLHRNFMGYTTRAGTDLVALGMTAISYVDGTFAQNQHKLNPYYREVQSGKLPVTRGWRLTRDDEIRSSLIQDLMCRGGVTKRDMEKKFGIDFDTYFADALVSLQPLAKDGLCTLTAERIEATFVGRILIRTLAMAFDAHLPKANDGLARFSATV